MAKKIEKINIATKSKSKPTKEKDKPAKATSKKELSLVDLVVKGMQEKKASGITILDLKKIKTAVADYFVLCSANTDNHADAISSSVEEEVWKGTNQNPWHKEGNQNKEWILLDYADVVVHVFRKDRREFYALDELWGDAEMIMLDDDTGEAIRKAPVRTELKKEVKKKEVKKTSSSTKNKTVSKSSTLKKKSGRK